MTNLFFPKSNFFKNCNVDKPSSFKIRFSSNTNSSNNVFISNPSNCAISLSAKLNLLKFFKWDKFSIFCKFRWFKSKDSTVNHHGSLSLPRLGEVTGKTVVLVEPSTTKGPVTKLSLEEEEVGSGLMGGAEDVVGELGALGLSLECCDVLLSEGEPIPVPWPPVCNDVDASFCPALISRPRAPVPLAYWRINCFVITSTLLTCSSLSSVVICFPSRRVSNGSLLKTVAVYVLVSHRALFLKSKFTRLGKLSRRTRTSSTRYNKLLFNSNFSMRDKPLNPSTRLIKLKPSSNLSNRSMLSRPSIL